MKPLLSKIFYSFPVQLLVLHFRKYQVLLVFWLILGSTVNGGFMKTFGADALFFVPEYLGNVNALSAALLGMGMGIFFMSWNITTFILHTKRFKFLAAASKPFLKYCINNSLLPLLFLLFYLVKSIQFNFNKELLTTGEELVLIGGFLAGLIFLLAFSFAFFFGADRHILNTIAPVIGDSKAFKASFDPHKKRQPDGFGMTVTSYFSLDLKLHKVRPVNHYSENFLDAIFRRHHFAAITVIVLAFIFLITAGFFLDHKIFQVPAAVSITIFSAILVAVIGALTYFLQSWSVLFVMVLLAVLDFMFAKEWLDTRNKAYGLNYLNKTERPVYSNAALQQLCTPAAIDRDKANMIAILDNWKKKQTTDKPKMVFINVSGGGLRSATFVMNMLQQIDSATSCNLMEQTFMISGASGGMLSAAYYRELYRSKNKGAAVTLNNQGYINDITRDLLNPVFTSLVNRDIFSPAQKFAVGPYTYVKDRGYAFEQSLNENAGNTLGASIGSYTEDERQAKIPLMIFNSVITRDGRKMMICSQPVSFMMKPLGAEKDSSASPDAVDFGALLQKQNPQNLRLLTALRMNATFPLVLPNVWLPTTPIIDVMDAGLRDNFGQETTLRFIDNFKDWIEANTSGVIIVQLMDRIKNNWQQPLEAGTVTDMLIRPATMLQHNWYKLQDYFQADQLSYLKADVNFKMNRLTFMYVPAKEDKTAALNFHLTAAEKKDVIASFYTSYNQQTLQEFLLLVK